MKASGRDGGRAPLRLPVLALALALQALFLLGCLASEEAVSTRYGDAADRLLRRGLTELGAHGFLEKIVSVGHRLTGSPQAAEAVELTRRLMLEMGLENVHLEPTTVGRWVRGGAECRVESELVGGIPLDALAAGGSVSTPEGGILAEVIEVMSFEELAAAGDKAVGKFVFFNRPMDPAALDTFGAYGAVAEQRSRGAVEAARAGGVAALVRSLTTSLDDFPHTGLMEYAADAVHVPAACLSTRSADRLSDALKRDPRARVFLRLGCERLEPVVSHNVVGDITGTEWPEEIILLGGHLDSWDLGTGAHDDGAGCAHALEALRLLKEVGLRPRRTVRAVMFMDEENGGTGGRDYARAEARRAERHLAALESDRGGFKPEGFGIGRDERQFKPFRKYEELMKRVGLGWLRPGGGGVDIGPLAAGGTLLIGLVPDSQCYFDYHHCGRDVLETVHPRELELGAVAMALLAYVLAEEGVGGRANLTS